MAGGSNWGALPWLADRREIELWWGAQGRRQVAAPNPPILNKVDGLPSSNILQGRPYEEVDRRGMQGSAWHGRRCVLAPFVGYSGTRTLRVHSARWTRRRQDDFSGFGDGLLDDVSPNRQDDDRSTSYGASVASCSLLHLDWAAGRRMILLRRATETIYLRPYVCMYA